jgi:hypothetical protein
VTEVRRTAATRAGTRRIDARNELPASATNALRRGEPIMLIASAPTAPGSASA